MYKEGKYEKALPIFKKIIERQSTNASLNQWYGVCLYETGDRTGAEKYLKFAASRNIQEPYRYLADIILTNIGLPNRSKTMKNIK